MRGIRRLALVGVNDLHEPADLLAADDEALRRLTALLVDRREPLVIERMLADSPTVAALEHACRGRAILVRRPAANCPFIPLDSSWLEPESHLNSGRRSDLRRARRKAEQAGPVRFEILTPGPADVDRLFDQAMAVEAKSWKGDAGTALAYDGRRAEFFRHYVHQAAREGVLRICFMYIGDSPAAMQIAVEQQQGFWLLKIGYDAGFATASPGLLLMRETIRYAAAAGLRTYEFLGRAEAWTTVWTNQERSTVTVRIFPFTVRGLAALAADALAAGGRKMLGKGSRGSRNESKPGRASLTRRLAQDNCRGDRFPCFRRQSNPNRRARHEHARNRHSSRRLAGSQAADAPGRPGLCGRRTSRPTRSTPSSG